MGDRDGLGLHDPRYQGDNRNEQDQEKAGPASSKEFSCPHHDVSLFLLVVLSATRISSEVRC
jgi:hypothetical protein